MSIFIQNSVGPTANPNGGLPTGRAGRSGEYSVADAHGRYQEAASQGVLFYAVNSAAQALSLSSTTTYTGLTVANPTGSNKNLVLLRAAWCTTIAPTGVGAVILGTGGAVAQTTGSSTGPVAGLLSSGAASVAKVGASCSYGANPAFLRPLIGIPWVTATGNGNMGQVNDEIAGELIVAPGQQVSLVAVTTAITGIGYMAWEEVPV